MTDDDIRERARFDILFGTGPSIDHHFCREWDEDGGCYGTNSDHGLSFDEACDKVAEWLETQAKQWRDRTHPAIAAIRSAE